MVNGLTAETVERGPRYLLGPVYMEEGGRGQVSMVAHLGGVTRLSI